MYYYATLDGNNVCIGVSSLSGEVVNAKMIRLEEYDADLLNKIWDGVKWNNPAPVVSAPTKTTDEKVEELKTLLGTVHTKINSIATKIGAV